MASKLAFLGVRICEIRRAESDLFLAPTNPDHSRFKSYMAGLVVESYELRFSMATTWQIRMKTIFRSHELWNLVEKGFATPAKEEEVTEAKSKLLRENLMKDAGALGITQGAVLDQIIFSRIAMQETAKAAWGILKARICW